MTLSLVFHPDARTELLEQARYLAASDLLAAARWLRAAQRSLDHACDHPQIGDVYWRSFRKLRPRGFKMLILYRVMPDTIGVAAILDGRMDPKHIRRILRDR